ncbi:MAG: 30S ribosomal protein S8 [Bradymonadales bacterium]|nr:MAG: 30S ribosomal protein S8 [Bradymonadales bacterium]
MITDTIADCLTRLRNAGMAGHAQFKAPHSNMNEGIFRILMKEGYLSGVEVVSEGPTGKRKNLVVSLRYTKDGKPAVNFLRRVSRPSHRVYRKAPEKLEVRSGFGLQILSTSKGLMTDKEAIEKKLGGEVIAELW